MSKKFTYFKGDKAYYTGKEEGVCGKKFYEVTLCEGHEKGKNKLVPTPAETTMGLYECNKTGPFCRAD